jgi:hypothetical protein
MRGRLHGSKKEQRQTGNSFAVEEKPTPVMIARIQRMSRLDHAAIKCARTAVSDYGALHRWNNLFLAETYTIGYESVRTRSFSATR